MTTQILPSHLPPPLSPVMGGQGEWNHETTALEEYEKVSNSSMSYSAHHLRNVLGEKVINNGNEHKDVSPSVASHNINAKSR